MLTDLAVTKPNAASLRTDLCVEHEILSEKLLLVVYLDVSNKITSSL